MKSLTCLLLPALLLASTATMAQGPSEARIICDRGPFGSKTYGGTAWDIYGCNDNRSVAVVTAPGNPALPFYFLFAERNGQYRLSGEGTGRPEITRKAYADLVQLSQKDIQGLVKETQKAAPRPGQ
ncbi:MAG TPA: hypothetical protein VGO42_13400 [Reyranella sp.]|nr:hypothetical protein [Reyranella sp.]